MAAGAAYLSFDGTTLFFDAVTNEQSEHSADATEHAVEQGSDVTDHIQQKNDVVTLDVIITNAPIRDVNNFYGGSFESVTLDVPKFDPPLLPTPGALFQTIGNAISSFLDGEKTFKASVLKWPTAFDAVRDSMAILLDWKERGVIGQAILPWRTFESMIITRISPVRNVPQGDCAHVTLELKRIRIVESKLVTAPIPTEDRGKINKPKGRQATSFTRDPGPKKSLLKKLIGG